MARREVHTEQGRNITAVVYWDTEWCEYVVSIGVVEADYYTSDRQDALDTARAMAGR